MDIFLKKQKEYNLGKSREDYITNLVIKGFSYKNSITAHIESTFKTGLWAGEEILIKKYFKQNTSILDIGCGTGRTSLPLARKGYAVSAIDIAPKMISAANGLLNNIQKNNLRVTFEVMNASNLKFSDNSFNNVLFSFNGIEYLPGKEGRRKTFQEIFRVLKPGGYFIFTTHTFLVYNRHLLKKIYQVVLFFLKKYFMGENGKELGECIRDSDPIWFVLYEHRMFPFSIKKLLRSVGFEIVYCNSRERIEANKRPPIIIDIRKEADFVFYVAMKPGKPEERNEI